MVADRATFLQGVLAWVVMVGCLSGCIEYFAEPPTLLVALDAKVGLDVVEDGGPHDAPPPPSDVEDLGDPDSPPPVDEGSDLCAPAAERCNGRDDDCDGRADEGTGEALCAWLGDPPEATTVCVAGRCVLDCHTGWHDLDGEYGNGCEYLCAPVDPPDTDAAEECNGRDDDCDGAIDEAEELDPPLVDDMVGVCADAPMACWRGGWRAPDPETLADGERDETRCDGLDNDCDGMVDERVYGCSCRDDQGLIRCEQGCDGRDDDLDGRSDEACLAVTCGAERNGMAPVPPCNGCPDDTLVYAGWVCIPAGEFTMGSAAGEQGRDEHEGPQRRVRITRPFMMRKREVTRAEWRAMFGGLPVGSEACDDECPVVWLNWYEAIYFANQMTALARNLGEDLSDCYETGGCRGNAGHGMMCDRVQRIPNCTGFRLPTEAEWEYAARAGTQTRFWSGEAEASLFGVAWYIATSGQRLHPVARLPPNSWGLHDIHGNAAEFVADRYDLYPPVPAGGAVDDPFAAVGGECGMMFDCRVMRGGFWGADASGVRSAAREAVEPNVRFPWFGIRLVRSLP